MSKSIFYTLDLVIKNVEEDKISADDPLSMQWFCEQMMKVIEELEKQESDEYRKTKFVHLYGQFEKLSNVFHILSKRKGEKSEAEC